MDSFSNSLLHLIQTHAEWAWFIIFLIALIESLAIIGFIMPGWIILVGVGTLIAHHSLSFYPILLSAYCGAVLGEYLSYWVGFHYHENILQWSLLKKHTQSLEKARIFFEKYGVAGLFFGRFIGPLRAIMPLLVGILQMKKKTFIWVNLFSGVFWAPWALFPGLIAGTAYQLDQSMALQTLLMGIVWIFIGGMAYRYGLLFYKSRQNNEKSPFLIVKSILSSLIFIGCTWELFYSDYSLFIQKIAFNLQQFL
jgi:membrane protein DedA with SNARE-associated domain